MTFDAFRTAYDGHKRLPLLHGPTPLHPLPRLSAHLGDVRILVKREDLTPVAFGGNKIRKLEHLTAEARTKGCDTLVTIGGIQSNHCRQTAAVAAMLGLRCDILLTDAADCPEGSPKRSGNRFLDGLLGARVIELPTGADRDAAMETHLSELRIAGARPYAMPAGGSTAIGSLGHVGTAIELAEQLGSDLDDLSLVLHGSGSGGTQAGLQTGMAGLGITAPLIGVSVGKDAATLAGIVDGLIQKAAPMLDLQAKDVPAAVVDDGFVGAGYAIPGPGTIEAIRLAAELEGLLLDPVYSGKAMEGLIARIRSGALPAGSVAVFVHTGGAPALFAYQDIFGASATGTTR